MKSKIGVAALLAIAFLSTSITADGPLGNRRYYRLQTRLRGCILDFTNNHGTDRRIYSAALCQKRAMYVYLPPGYDPCRAYPVLLWFHGFRQDEHEFLGDVAGPIDRAIACGQLPPLIAAAPDGTFNGQPSILRGNSFFINSLQGRFEDYILQDLWPFLLQNFAIHPAREAHVLGGVSMGGFAAYNLAMKHQSEFGAAMGIFPPLNVRWVDCHGRYAGNFDPNCWGWRTSLDNQREVIGSFAGGLIRIRARRMFIPLFDHLPDAIDRLSEENPTERLLRGEVSPGALALWVGYGGKDEFNIDAQIESFLYVARERGIDVTVRYEPKGHHDVATARRMVPCLLRWLAQVLEPYRVPASELAPAPFEASPASPD